MNPHDPPNSAPRAAAHPPGTAADLFPSDDAKVDPSVLVINGEVITIDRILGPLRKDLESKASEMSPARYQTYAQDALTRQIRNEAREVLLYQPASRRVTDEEKKALDKYVDKQVRDTINEKHGGRQTRYEKELASAGSSLTQERERIRRELIIIRYVRQTVGSHVAEPTRSDLWQFYQEQKATLAKPERRELFLIEQTPDADGRAKIEQARAALAAGEAFDDVARRLSTGPHAAAGGAWGLVSQGSVREKFEPAVAALFALRPEQVSDMIETPEALFLVRCGAVAPAQVPDFEKLQPELVKRYNDFQFNVRVDELVSKLHAQAVIRPQNLNLFLQAAIAAAPKPALAGGP